MGEEENRSVVRTNMEPRSGGRRAGLPGSRGLLRTQNLRLPTHIPLPSHLVSGLSHCTSPNAASAPDCTCLHVSVTEVVKSSNLAGRSFTVSSGTGDRRSVREPKGEGIQGKGADWRPFTPAVGLYPLLV